MILTAHQPAYLPWLGLFHKIALADRFIKFDQVQYASYDWVSRNRILGPNGPMWLRVPCLKKDRFGQRICDVEIDNSLPWARKHWSSIRLSYGKAPHFRRYADFLEDMYGRVWNRLADLDDHMLRYLLQELGIAVPVESAGRYDFQGEKSDLVLDMCRQLGATAFIFGALGRDYADVASFEKVGVRAIFQEYAHPVYPQLHKPFVSHLSVFDLLFNCGPDSLDIIMSCNVSRAEVCHV